MNIVDYFDIGNYEHLKAWEELQEKGSWPDYFWKDIKNRDFPPMWQMLIAFKMADAYVKATLDAMEEYGENE